jgi:hypothetical protein
MNENFAEKLAQSINDMQMKKLANASSYESINNSSMYMLMNTNNNMHKYDTNSNNQFVGSQTTANQIDASSSMKKDGTTSTVTNCNDDNAVNLFDETAQYNIIQASGSGQNLIGKYVSNFQMNLNSDSNCSIGLNSGNYQATGHLKSNQFDNNSNQPYDPSKCGSGDLELIDANTVGQKMLTTKKFQLSYFLPRFYKLKNRGIIIVFGKRPSELATYLLARSVTTFL